jgi:hypothetical protein
VPCRCSLAIFSVFRETRSIGHNDAGLSYAIQSASTASRREKDEHRKFGDDGFEMMVDRVAGLKRALDIYDLAKFTPH